MPRKIIVLFIWLFVLALMAPQASHAESMLTWDAVAEAQGYKIYYGTSSGSYIYSKDAGNVTQYPLDNLSLEEGTTYYFVVRAYNDAGESDNSSETSYTVPSAQDTTPPLAPQGVTASTLDVNITLNWQVNTESDLAGYKVYYGNTSRSYGPSIPAGNVTSYTINNLEPGKTYYLGVSALDSSGNESGYSAEVVETIPPAPGGPPPEGPKLQWNAVTGDVTGYKVYYGTSSGNYPESFDVGNVTQCALSDLPLAEGTTYYFAVRAYFSAGESDYSTEISYSLGTPPSGCQLELGHPDYCIECGPCEAGLGDCDPGQCQSGLVCVNNVGANYGWDPGVDVCESPPDTTAPVVNISGPTSGGTYEASSSSINLSGSASDNVVVGQVSWVNSKGGSGTASGTSSWSISGIQLSEGENVLTVTAKDAAGNQSTDTLSVIYTPPSGCQLELGHPDYCVECGPCEAGLGDCDPGQCQSGLVCVNNVGANYGWDPGVDVCESPPDTTAPVVNISGPTSGGTYEASSSSINLSGSASDNVVVGQVSWVNSKGGSGTASGTSSWSISGIQLSEGENVLTVTAKDAAGNQSTDTLSVIYTPPSGCQLELGHPDYCIECGPCEAGLGDCDPGQCQSGLVCVNNVGANYGWDPGVDVCESPPDTTAPVVNISGPTSGGTYEASSSSINLSGSASDNVVVGQVSWVNSKGGSGTASGTSSWSISGIQLSEGENVLTVTAKDAAGNQSTDTLSVIYTPPSGCQLELGHPDYCIECGPCEAGLGDCDPGQCQSGLVCVNNVGANYGWDPGVDVCESPPDTTAPVVNISGPTSGGTYEASSSSINLSGSASDNVVVGQVSWVNSKGGSGTASGTSSWSISGIQLSEGENVLTVTAKDAAGNQSTDTLNVAYTPPDTIGPSVSITSPTSGNTYETSSSSINLSGSASDNVAVSQVIWNNDRGGSDVASGTTSWSIADVDLAEGANLITVTATDAAGNQSTDTLTVSYTAPDTTDPVLTIQVPTETSSYSTESSSIDLSGIAADNIGLSQVTWVNSKGGSGTASGTSSWSISNIQLSEGDNVLTVTATDTASNQSTDTLTVSYTAPDTTPPPDTTAPVVTIKSPTTRTKYRTKSSSINLSGSASDDVGVSQVTWVNSLGGSGTASGTSSWSISNIPLSKGDNILTVTATDAAGNQSTDTLKMTKR